MSLEKSINTVSSLYEIFDYFSSKNEQIDAKIQILKLQLSHCEED